MVCEDPLPEVVHEVQVRLVGPARCRLGIDVSFSYIVAAGLDGGTQVISFILNFVRTFRRPNRLSSSHLVQAVFGAAGTAHPFPEWWGNGQHPMSSATAHLY